MKTFKLKVITLIVALTTAVIYLSAFASPQTLDFVTISDIHLNTSAPEMLINPTRDRDSNNPKGKGGDLDAATFTKLLTNPTFGIAHEISANMPQAKFVIILGDTAGHTDIDADRPKNLGIALTQLRTNLPLPLLYVMGNNDSPADHYGYFVAENIAVARTADWDNVFLSTGVNCFNVFPCLFQENVGDGEGYFAAYLATGLKFIGMNSVFFTKKKGIDETNPKELNWLDEQLKNSEGENERVLIGMHVPPAKWRKSELKEFGKIIKKYPNTVIGILAGHTHTEDLAAMVFQYENQNHLIPIINTASLSSRNDNAPSFKHFVLTQDANNSWAIKDFTTYTFIQKDPADAIKLNKYYSFDSAYCPGADTTVAECMTKQIPKFKTTDKFAFSRAFENKATERSNVGNPNLPGTKTVTEILLIK